MNRQQAKELLPIIQAFAEGKTIQYYYRGENWVDVKPNESVDFSDDVSKYRIKPKQEYRPFKDSEECWNEMQRHQPFGWTKLKGEIEYSFMTDVNDNINYSDAIRDYTFADGTPFGIKVEE